MTPLSVMTTRDASPEAASALSSSNACSRQYESRSGEARRRSPRMLTPNSSWPMTSRPSASSAELNAPAGVSLLMTRARTERAGAAWRRDASREEKLAHRRGGRAAGARAAKGAGAPRDTAPEIMARGSVVAFELA